MNKYLFLFLLLTSITYSQKLKSLKTENNSLILKLKFDELKYVDIRNKEFTIRDYYEFSDEAKPNSYKLSNIQVIVAIPPNSTPSLETISQKIETFSKTIPAINTNENNKLNNNYSIIFSKEENVKKPLIELKGTFWMRDFYCAVLTINTSLFDLENNSIEEIKEIEFKLNFNKSFTLNDNSPIQINDSFDMLLKNIIINSHIAEQFRGIPNEIKNEKLDGWINYNSEYLKLGVSQDGIYRISFNDLQSLGVTPSDIDIKKLKLFKKGEQIEIFISGNNDDKFDENEYLEFYGTKNYSQNSYRDINSEDEPYNEFLDRYSNESIYWLTWSGEDGKRVLTQKSFNGNILDTLKVHKDIKHYEVNNALDYTSSDLVNDQHPDWQSRETWFDARYNPGIYNRNFFVNNMVIDTEVDIYFKVYGFASNLFQNAHSVSLRINNFPENYDSSSFNKFEQKLLHAKLSSSKINEGKNTVKFISFETDAYPNNIAVDWYDVEYKQYLRLEEDSLKINFSDILLEKEYLVEVMNASTENYVIYKINNKIKKIDSLKIIGNKLYFADTIKTNSEYIVTSEKNVKTPKFYYVKNLQNIIETIPQSDYLLITSSDFLFTAHNYVEFIKSNYSKIANVVDINDIYDQFNFGYFSPEPIRTFLQTIFNEWKNTKLEYVFLVGEANYDYKNNSKQDKPKPNIVPSYGHPVSDNWFAIWDDVLFIPQINIGRLACSSIDEFQHYYSKHEKYLSDSYSRWNKSFLLFSGGLDESSRQFSKRINDELNADLIKNIPIGGYSQHFFSTSQPPSNFGPFDKAFVDSTIAAGAIAISYVGHSGTKIWDNGIEDVSQLKNSKNQGLFITDFGCSTGKFAEPDIVSFGEAFTNGLEGEAIGYVGNASLGFTSTASIFPKVFYSELLLGNESIGSAFTAAKISFLNKYGISSVNKIFLYTNTLFADPILKLKKPDKPNLNVESKDFIFPEFLDDNLDSIDIKISYRNLGIVDSSSYSILINDYYFNKINFTTTLTRKMPLNDDFIYIKIPSRNFSGEHRIEFYLDSKEQINELNESDNRVVFNYNIQTSSVRLLSLNKLKNKLNSNIRYLNSVKKGFSENLLIEIDTTNQFLTPLIFSSQFDTIVTDIKLSKLRKDNRYWMRMKIQGSEDYFNPVSFIFTEDEQSFYYLSDSVSFSNLSIKNLKFDNTGITLNDKKISLSLKSDGFNDGGTAKVQLDGVDYANNAQGCGHQIIVFDDKSFKYIESQWFNMWADPNFSNYINFLDTLSSDKYIAVALSNFCGGAGVNQELIDKLAEYGSTMLENVKYNTSWLFFGKKGNTPLESIELFSDSGTVFSDTSFITKNKDGWIETEIFSKGIETNFIKILGNFSNNSINIQPIILDPEIDTLATLQFQDSTVSLASLNSLKERNKKFRVNFFNNNVISDQKINSIEIDIDLSPELAINYQVVSVEKDTVQQGEDANLQFYVYNVGESSADSFNVTVDIVKPDNSKEKIFEEIVDSIGSEKRKKFNIAYPTTNFNGPRTFSISIDTEEKIDELFEDNNFYNIPFYVVGDTTKPTMNLTIDGNDIFDGEYISSQPKIKIELSDPSLVPITDTASISIFLNNKYINYLGNENSVSVNFSQTNPKVTVNYTPILEDGEYTLRVFGKDASGNVGDSSGIIKTFNVQSDAKLLNVYNYPNPFNSDTYFTFKLTQIPDDIKIKVFTIAGRLIKEIELNSAQLNYDLNKIYWDGRDDDGDLIGNGVYLYKVIMDVDGKKQDVTQKLAIVR